MRTIGIAIIGCGGIALANHVPGFSMSPGARIAALCDSDPAVLERARQQTGVTAAYADYRKVVALAEVDAVVIATPNYLHAPIALAAIAARKHVLCEKPIAMNYAEAIEMYRAAEAAGIRHMTAFTYRFVPAMAYMAQLVRQGFIGRPYHFRANRFQDWGARFLGWRQSRKLAATGEMGDMLSHRIDYGHLLLGPMTRIVARTRRFIDQRGGQPADVEDWVAMLGDFEAGATGVWESTKLATGRSEGARSQDYCEVNGSEGSLIYQLSRPHELQVGKPGAASLEMVRVPEELMKHPASSRDPWEGDPLITFRYDQDAEFVAAIRENRPCEPSFLDGARVQAVMDAALLSESEGRWVDVPRLQG